MREGGLPYAISIDLLIFRIEILLYESKFHQC
jgi:hypothetical protein